jgi:hypothetical protein
LYLKTCSINGLKPYCEDFKNLEIVLNWFDAFLQKIENKTKIRKEKGKRNRKIRKRPRGPYSAHSQIRPTTQQVNPKRVSLPLSPLADMRGPHVRLSFLWQSPTGARHPPSHLIESRQTLTPSPCPGPL